MSSNTQKRDLLDKRQELQDAKREARNRVCREPKYPGKPEDYIYVLQEYCRPRDGSSLSRRTAGTGAGKARQKVMLDAEADASASAPADKNKQRKRAANIASIDREISMLTKILDAHGPNYVDKTPNDSQFTLLITPTVFQLMIEPRLRASFPDPSKRYTKSLASIKKNLKSHVNFDASDIPRYMVLRMVLDHLEASKAMYDES